MSPGALRPLPPPSAQTWQLSLHPGASGGGVSQHLPTGNGAERELGGVGGGQASPPEEMGTRPQSLSGSIGGGQASPQERRGLGLQVCAHRWPSWGGLQVPAGRGPRKGHRMATERAGGEQTPICFLPWVEGCPTEPPAAASGVWVL